MFTAMVIIVVVVWGDDSRCVAALTGLVVVLFVFAHACVVTLQIVRKPHMRFLTICKVTTQACANTHNTTTSPADAAT